MRPSPESTIPDTFTVVAWNILLDKTRTRNGLVSPQADRIDAQADTLKQMELDLDVVAILEAERTEMSHNGELLARQLGFEASYWYHHNRKGEYVGAFGLRVKEAEVIDLGHNKKAVITMVGSVAVVGIHLKREQWGNKRAEQIGELLERVDEYEQAVVMGDLNAIPLEKAPRMLRSHGFRSVYRQLGQKQPPTWPAAGYRDVMLGPWQQRLLRKGVAYDDIYTRGLEALEAGTFVGDSDHAGVWATLRS